MAGDGENDDNDEDVNAEGPELPEETGGYPPLDFNTFILSLSTSALMNMGEVSDSESGQVSTNMALARQTIDLIALLEDKTQGNLTGEEERLLSQILYDLRMRYLAALEKDDDNKSK